MAKGILRGLIAFISVLIVAVLLLVAAYALPTAKMQERLNVDWPALQDNWNAQVFPQVPNGATDHATDYHMLALAACDEYGNPLEGAMLNPFGVSTKGISQLDHLEATLHLTEESHTAPYTRYWHGYLVPLKVELLLMGYYSILFYNGGVLLGLVLVVTLLMHKKGMGCYIPPLFLTLVLCGVVNISLTMELYASAYITLLSMILVLALGKHLDPIAGTFFLIVGMLTNYMDFLTFPIVTLALPLIIHTLLPHEDRCKVTARRAIMLASCWAIGYAGMWVAKWLVGSLILGQNLFTDALSQAAVRTSSTIGHELANSQGDLTYTAVLKDSILRLVGTYPALGCVALTVLWELVMTIRNRARIHTHTSRFKDSLLPLLICFLMPFAWAFVLKNHTYMHSYFTFRTFAPIVAAPLCLWATLFAPPAPHEQNKMLGKHFRNDGNVA